MRAAASWLSAVAGRTTASCCFGSFRAQKTPTGRPLILSGSSPTRGSTRRRERGRLVWLLNTKTIWVRAKWLSSDGWGRGPSRGYWWNSPCAHILHRNSDNSCHYTDGHPGRGKSRTIEVVSAWSHLSDISIRWVWVKNSRQTLQQTSSSSYWPLLRCHLPLPPRDVALEVAGLHKHTSSDRGVAVGGPANQRTLSWG